jgi:hypothetical protein
MASPDPRVQRARCPSGLVPCAVMELMLRDEEHAVRDQSRD